eukprot:3933073-Rhodomonas_salina.1
MIVLWGGESRCSQAEGVNLQLGERLGLCWRARLKRLTRKQHQEFLLSCVMEALAVAAALCQQHHLKRKGTGWKWSGRRRGCEVS